AVALSYKEDMVAPTIVASGSGKVAENILTEAKKNQIPVYEDKKLATILTELEIGEAIPQELYEIVAKILLFVGDMDELYAKTKGYHE
ncbi:MAG: EscU/YscU/HrcU family type III secretion system export apparatus switch protein, partial [Candidatus Cellulosilyticum pullistercoris]|nr:EscU/YscU/HrcU family type III secretion system export apparatus switch protein [Candidatus Cellulosilyticum pullistercoris]